MADPRRLRNFVAGEYTDAADGRLLLPGPPWARAYDVVLDTADERPTPGLRHDTGGRVRLSPFSVAVLGVGG